MNIKLLTILIIISLYFTFGFDKKSYSLNKGSQDDISELKILKYLPKDSKTFFISNTRSSQIRKNIRKNYETKEQDDFVLIKNSILAYLGLDLGTNKLEDIYDNELTLATFDNQEKDIDDILITFKIQDTKFLDDVLNSGNSMDETDVMFEIFRENKLNFLKYIYRTNDNYILTSSNQKLILDALESSNKYISSKEVLNNFKNEHNILLTKNFNTNELLNNENYLLTRDYYLVTLFNFKDKEIILKSYLMNNNKSSDITSYEKIDKEIILAKKNYQIFNYSNLFDSNKYLKHYKISSFEKNLFKELNEKLKQNILLLISDQNWVIIFEKNILSAENIKLLKDFNKNSIGSNNKIYTIYSKDTLKKEANTIKQTDYKKIFSIQSDKLLFISNSLINEEDIDLISKEFFNIKGDIYAKYFLNKKIIIKNPYTIEINNIYNLKKINNFFRNIINLSILEFKAILKQSIPETTPIYYAETNLKIF